MTKKSEDLRKLARVIKNETAVGGNTAERVGSAFEGVADAIEGIEQINQMEKAVDEVKKKLNESKRTIEQMVSELPIAQETGDSPTKVMSQKAVTDALSKGGSDKYEERKSVDTSLYKYLDKHDNFVPMVPMWR